MRDEYRVAGRDDASLEGVLPSLTALQAGNRAEFGLPSLNGAQSHPVLRFP